jgi:hypothetical protein
MDLLITATLLSALLIAFGGAALVRPRARTDADDAPSARPQDDLAGASAQPTPPLARLKALVAARDWARVMPSLLIIAGLLGVMLFGSLSLLFVLGHTAAGVASLAVSLFAMAKLAIDYARA